MFECEHNSNISMHHPDGYSYELFAGDSLGISYKEIRLGIDTTTTIYFGSLEEMEDVAKSMLRLVESIKQLKD